MIIITNRGLKKDEIQLPGSNTGDDRRHSKIPLFSEGGHNTD